MSEIALTFLLNEIKRRDADRKKIKKTRKKRKNLSLNQL